MKPFAALALMVLSLAACGPRLVTSDVTRFHALPPAPPARTFTILPSKAQTGSLEFQAYANQIAAALSERGWRPVPAEGGRIGDAVVFLDYGVDEGRTRIWSEPTFTTGLGWGHGHSPWGWGYGAHIPIDRVRSDTSFLRWLEVEMAEGPAWRAGRVSKLFEGRAVSEGGARALPEVMPYLVTALFDRFPGPSGQTVRVSVPVPGR
ncbi:MAG: DUF4136 domain-containing protein [Alphaproteobacteria bacterium]|nr:DUF4136 domain-containing protein [Alphaproteobacteria bacterium]